MRRRTFLWLGLAGAGALLAGGATWRSFSMELERARARLIGRSAVFQSRFGDMEYATAGDGAPVLMIHGTGGGFDQGLDFAEPLSAAGWRGHRTVALRLSALRVSRRSVVSEPSRRVRRPHG